ncbi:DUF1707 SHOCT-like domain-containing protein [Symbioplanes lichenis]|uniref:DUF1707 SHOCT-like domain-containing protein n=1 Tax=Symbioplanes lichenis TaxID=1629072 RepID=UPI0027395D54|nr:DUF1707 domain-containing protein [Actinoplanes lichenis]
MTDVSHVRVSDADRNSVIVRLQDATAEGRLSLDELDDRIAAALAARTWADLDPLVGDLPAAPEPEAELEESGEYEPVPPLALVGAVLTAMIGALAVPVSFGSAWGPAMGIVATLLGTLVLLAPGELNLVGRWAVVIGMGLGLMPVFFFIAIFLAAA